MTAGILVYHAPWEACSPGGEYDQWEAFPNSMP